MKLHVATASYPVQWWDDFNQWHNDIDQWVQSGVDNKAQLLVFPEYAWMSLASLFGRDVCADLTLQIEKLQTIMGDIMAVFETLSQKHGIYIVAGTFPVIQNDKTVNTAWVFSPDGYMGGQDKQMMTRFEDEQWTIQSGDPLRTFEIGGKHFGIITCYDSEFPILGRKCIELGADFLICPSCTSTVAGYNRVQIGCRARAMEQGCYVIHSPLVGYADWIESVDENVGCAGVYSPCDIGCPDDGIVAIGQMDTPQWVYATLDFDITDTVRKNGSVFNYNDWDKQF
jgi:predicted amidohydrolase